MQKKREDEIESLKAKLGEVTSAGEELETDLRKMALGTQNVMICDLPSVAALFHCCLQINRNSNDIFAVDCPHNCAAILY